jgi:hypothetical protein
VPAAFLCAAVAHGDIAFVVGCGARGVVWSVGLASHGGTMASDKWKNVLDGKLLAPTLPVRFAPSW